MVPWVIGAEFANHQNPIVKTTTKITAARLQHEFTLERWSDEAVAIS